MGSQPYGSSVLVLGHNGMVGSAIVRKLRGGGIADVLIAERSDLDLTNQAAVHAFFANHRPDQVYFAAAKVGGIHANDTYPADFIYANLIMEANVIHAAFKSGVSKLMFLGSSCIYPRDASQPIAESALLTGPLEPTNEPYAVAKIAGIKLCESYNRQYGTDFRSVMPTNLYGPGDNYHPENSHVIPALIRRFHEAKHQKTRSVTVWGSGKPRREFLFVDDLAEACVHVMSLPKERYQSVTTPRVSHINIGAGSDVTIEELARLVKEAVGYPGELAFDDSRPDGAPRKLMNSELARDLGWKPTVALSEGLLTAYDDFLRHHPD